MLQLRPFQHILQEIPGLYNSLRHQSIDSRVNGIKPSRALGSVRTPKNARVSSVGRMYLQGAVIGVRHCEVPTEVAEEQGDLSYVGASAFSVDLGGGEEAPLLELPAHFGEDGAFAEVGGDFSQVLHCKRRYGSCYGGNYVFSLLRRLCTLYILDTG